MIFQHNDRLSVMVIEPKTTFFEHLVDNYTFFTNVISNLLTGRKNRNMMDFRFLRESSQGEASIQCKVVRSLGVSKTKRASTSQVTVVGSLIERTRSPSIPVDIPLAPTASGTSSRLV